MGEKIKAKVLLHTIESCIIHIVGLIYVFLILDRCLLTSLITFFYANLGDCEWESLKKA